MGTLPSISIVVPNFNSAHTLAAALQSLLDQHYPKLEIIVVDGGSTDDSLAVIRQFEPHLAWWVSEKDRGQSHAINKGLAHCTGDVVNWLNSDDLLCPGALHAVGEAFAAGGGQVIGSGRAAPHTTSKAATEQTDEQTGDRPGGLPGLPGGLPGFPGGVDVVVGVCRAVLDDQPGRPILFKPDAGAVALMPCFNPIGQPSCFFRRSLLDRPQPIDESYHYIMDFELWMVFRERGARWKFIPQELSLFPLHGENKTLTGGAARDAEIGRLYRQYTREWIPLTFWHMAFRRPLQQWKQRRQGLLRAGATWIGRGLDWLLTPIYGYWRVRTMHW